MTIKRTLLGLGSNQNHPELQLQIAWQLLHEVKGLEPLSRSRIYHTEPIGGPIGQPMYYNAVALIHCELSPNALLKILQSIEEKLHRQREVRWGPRTIDLDILLMENLVIETSSLIIPHPRLTWRSFVLEPAAEITPDILVPRWNKTILELRNLHRLNLMLAGSSPAWNNRK